MGDLYCQSSWKKVFIPDEVNDKKNVRRKPAFLILIRLLFKQSTFSALHVYINPFLLNCCSPRMLIYLYFFLYLHLNLYCHILYGKSEIKNIYDLPLKDRICSYRSKFFHLRVDLTEKEVPVRSRAGSTALRVGAGGGCFGSFFSHLPFLPTFSLSGIWPDIDWNTVSKDR